MASNHYGRLYLQLAFFKPGKALAITGITR